MTALSSCRPILIVLAVLWLAVPVGTAADLDAALLLDQYAAGRFDEAVSAVSQATREQARSLRTQLWRTGMRWVGAVPDGRSRRLLAAAAFGLEAEVARAERGDWPTFVPTDCAGRCVLEWARSLLLLRGDPDDAERVWWRASTALLEGARDWRFLHTAADPQQPFGASLGHLTHGLDRFAGDPHLQMARAFAVGNRFLVVTDGAPRGPLPGMGPDAVLVVTMGRGGPPVGGAAPAGSRALRQLVALRDSVEGVLEALSHDPEVGAEARVRLGYLYWTGGQDGAARTELQAVADLPAADPDVRYLAHFLLGVVAQSNGDADTARAEFAAALLVRPGSQSAALGLGALQFQQGDVDSAYDVVRDSLSRRSGSDDPWRQFMYGSFRKLPTLISELRLQVRR